MLDVEFSVNCHTATSVFNAVWVVAGELEIVVGELEDRLHGRVDLHAAARAARSHSSLRLLQMVEIKVGAAEGVHEVTRLQSRYSRHHHRQCIGGDVERHTEETSAER